VIRRFETAAYPKDWQKGTLLDPVGQFKAKARIWVKKNTESPWSFGPSFWVFGPKTRRLVHLGQDVFYQFVQIDNSTKGYATPEQKKELDKRFTQVVKPVLKKWALDRSKSKEKYKGKFQTLKQKL
jgi:hypothetical protein